MKATVEVEFKGKAEVKLKAEGEGWGLFGCRYLLSIPILIVVDDPSRYYHSLGAFPDGFGLFECPLPSFISPFLGTRMLRYCACGVGLITGSVVGCCRKGRGWSVFWFGWGGRRGRFEQGR